MWIMLPDAYISAVAYITNPPQDHLLLVRARVKGDLEKLFPGNTVERTVDADYLYRTIVTRNQLKLLLLNEVDRIDYKNFKNAVPTEDKPRHDAYLKCWTAMNHLQEQLDPESAAAKWSKWDQHEKWYQRDPDPTLLDAEFDSAWENTSGHVEPVLPRQSGVAGEPTQAESREVRQDSWIPGKVGKISRTRKNKRK